MDTIRSDYTYSHDEVVILYGRRNQPINGTEQVLTTEEFINFVCSKLWH